MLSCFNFALAIISLILPNFQVAIHDERGCLRPRNEYTGPKSGTEDDEMCVAVKSKAIAANTRLAEEILSEFKTWSGIVSQKK